MIFLVGQAYVARIFRLTRGFSALRTLLDLNCRIAMCSWTKETWSLRMFFWQRTTLFLFALLACFFAMHFTSAFSFLSFHFPSKLSTLFFDWKSRGRKGRRPWFPVPFWFHFRAFECRQDLQSVRLGDFGISKNLRSTASLCQTVVGTQAFPGQKLKLSCIRIRLIARWRFECIQAEFVSTACLIFWQMSDRLQLHLAAVSKHVVFVQN